MVLLPILDAAAALHVLCVLAAAPRIAARDDAQAARHPERSPIPVEAITGL